MKKPEIARFSIPVWIAMIASAALFIVGAMRAPESARPESRARRQAPPAKPRPAPRFETPAPEVLPVSPAAEPESAAAPAGAVPAIAVPADVEGNAQSLRAWILGLSDRDLAGLVGTPALDRMVARVVEQLSPPSELLPPPVEIDDFLSRLNIRIETVQRLKKS